MKIKMIKTTPGSVDGIHVQDYKEGEEYTVNSSLGNVFVQVLKVAVEVKEEKMFSPAPENKMVDPVAEENKSETSGQSEFVYRPRKRK